MPGCGGTLVISAAPAANASAPSGRLTRKIGRQSRPQKLPAMSEPPMIGPQTEARLAERPKNENIKPFSWGGKVTWAMAKTCGVIAEAAKPCSTRAPIRVSMVGAMPHSSEPSVKPATPIRNIFLRPMMSPSRPKGKSPRAKASA